MNLNRRTINQIRKERETQNISQLFVAKKMHISVSAYSRIESGHVSITLTTIEKISGILQVSIENLLCLPRSTEMSQVSVNIQMPATNTLTLSMKRAAF